MKIMIPTNGEKGLDEEVADHFGRSQTYTLYDSDTKEVRVFKNESEHMGGSGKPPDKIIGEGAEIVLCKGLGRRAIQLFNEAGITVYCGATGTVKDALQDYEEKKLDLATEDNSCKRHAFRKEDPEHECKH